MNLEIITFDPSVEELQKIVAVTSQITATDLSDDTQLAVVHDTRISLRDARVKIEKAGKEYRAEALKYQKDVIAREKELIAIIEPEEIRLKALEDEANQRKERAAREALLPMRKAELEKVKTLVDDDFILDMDNDTFIQFLNASTTANNEMIRLELEAEKTRLADDARIAQVRKDAEVAERNRIEAAAKADEQARIEKAAQAKRDAEDSAQKLVDDAKAEAERTVQAAKDKVAQQAAQAEAAAREAEVRKQQEADAAAKREAEGKYLAWAKLRGWTPELAPNFETRHTAAGIELWRLVGTYTE